MWLARAEKIKTRLSKILLTFVLLLFAVFFVGYLKYGQDGGWPAVIDQFIQRPKGLIAYSAIFCVFVYDYFSIAFFKMELEKTSDEITWDAHHAGSGEKIPGELKIFIYPFVLLTFLVFI
jgi:hypothetical protein